VEHNAKVLHVGDILFPVAWQDWYAEVEKIQGCRLEVETVADFACGQAGLKPFLFTRVSSRWAPEVAKSFLASSHTINQIHFVDMVYKKNGNLWPYLLHKDAIHSVILARQPYLNIKGGGLIVGMTAEAILAAYVLVELGIRQITFVVESEKASEATINLLKRSIFEVRIEAISKDKVILLPGVYSVVICYEDLRKQAELVTALLYFNYLERGGIVLNVGMALDKIPLLEEASAIGANTVDLIEIQVHAELMALAKVLPMSQEVSLKLAAAAGFASLDQGP
jgi:hypothetical protein